MCIFIITLHCKTVSVNWYGQKQYHTWSKFLQTIVNAWSKLMTPVKTQSIIKTVLETSWDVLCRIIFAQDFRFSKKRDYCNHRFVVRTKRSKGNEILPWCVRGHYHWRSCTPPFATTPPLAMSVTKLDGHKFEDPSLANLGLPYFTTVSGTRDNLHFFE